MDVFVTRNVCEDVKVLEKTIFFAMKIIHCLHRSPEMNEIYNKIHDGESVLTSVSP